MNEAVRALTNGKGVDIALDAVGGDIFEPTLKTLRRVDSTTSSKSEMAVGLADRPSKTKAIPRFR
jgi:NADPH:quinone reductase